MIFFTADTHYGHDRIRDLCKRPYATTDEMNLAMIAQWNMIVQPTDEVWHLGDFCFHDAVEHFVRLRGHKHLLIGNHDARKTLRLSWASMQHYKELKIGGTTVVLSHYPFDEWNNYYHGSLHLHGHTHGKLPDRPRRCDVGVDRWKFTPVTLEQIKTRLAVI